MDQRNHPFAFAKKEITLLDILNCVLNKGVVVQGSLIVSIANIDLIYIDLHIIVTSVETALANQMFMRRSKEVGRTNR